jgi:hypothetical protein
MIDVIEVNEGEGWAAFAQKGDRAQGCVGWPEAVLDEVHRLPLK